jgi:hypothetical protein
MHFGVHDHRLLQITAVRNGLSKVSKVFSPQSAEKVFSPQFAERKKPKGEPVEDERKEGEGEEVSTAHGVVAPFLMSTAS